MNERRRVWQEAHGAIPKGWLVHSLNGNRGDVRLENLAAIPRKPVHQGQVTAPYVERIRKLEKELKLKGDKLNGTK
uniref:Putative homing endonuclease n=1 Tax=viral metagenome TaxID=1070528 RepID=A0A6M3LDT1_9ZZZZ